MNQKITRRQFLGLGLLSLATIATTKMDDDLRDLWQITDYVFAHLGKPQTFTPEDQNLFKGILTQKKTAARK